MTRRPGDLVEVRTFLTMGNRPPVPQWRMAQIIEVVGDVVRVKPVRGSRYGFSSERFDPDTFTPENVRSPRTRRYRSKFWGETVERRKVSRNSRYVGQCDRTRRLGAREEALWQQMIALARQISRAEFARNVDLSPLLDEDETPESFLSDLDRTSTFYESVWGDRRCWFIDTHGFEFIFVED